MMGQYLAVVQSGITGRGTRNVGSFQRMVGRLTGSLPRSGQDRMTGSSYQTGMRRMDPAPVTTLAKQQPAYCYLMTYVKTRKAVILRFFYQRPAERFIEK
jgi:hypothetical protein